MTSLESVYTVGQRECLLFMRVTPSCMHHSRLPSGKPVMLWMDALIPDLAAAAASQSPCPIPLLLASG